MRSLKSGVCKCNFVAALLRANYAGCMPFKRAVAAEQQFYSAVLCRLGKHIMPIVGRLESAILLYKCFHSFLFCGVLAAERQNHSEKGL